METTHKTATDLLREQLDGALSFRGAEVARRNLRSRSPRRMIRRLSWIW
jgi:hypothetical protein